MAIPPYPSMLGALYRRLLKPILFQCDPEFVHNRFVQIGALLGSNPLGRVLTRAAFCYEDSILATTVAGIPFANPVGLAAGFDKNGRLWNILPDVGFGFAELGSITGKPCTGNVRPRLRRIPTHEALYVNYGLMNDGATAIAARLQNIRPRMAIGISAAKTNCVDTADPDVAITDYCAVLNACQHLPGYRTLNISCPNAFGGQPFTNPALLDRLLTAADPYAVARPLFLKLSPDLDRQMLDDLLAVIETHRITGLVCTNLTKNPSALRISTRYTPGTGGISGRPIRAVADDQLAYLARNTGEKYVLIGVGGIFSAADAYRKIRLGASLVQLMTGMIYRGPQLIGEINRGLAAFLRRDGFSSVADAVGTDI